MSGKQGNSLRQIWRIVQTVIGLIFRHPIAGVSIIPVLADGTIVLIQRRDNGRWGLPGGFIDWGETIPEGARRELKEETGLTLIQLGRLVGVYSAPDRDPRVHSICIVLEAKVTGEFEILDSLEIEAVAAFQPNQIPFGQLSHDHDRHLQDYFQGLTTIA
jgi:ADP-ribose pyrophosphatase YjhB (NUDIX family)